MRAPVLVGGTVLYLATAAGVFVWQKGRHVQEDEIENIQLRNSADKARLYRKISKKYDTSIALDEKMMLLPYIRRQLLKRATGKVLEVAGGTGRNLTYYDPSCELTITDGSEDMLKIAREKVSKDEDLQERVSFCVQDAEDLAFPSDEFDTVVDTFGMCSVNNPHKLLSEMQRVCKPGGLLLLLEHGESDYQWLSNLQAKGAKRHYDKWGCIYNRNIGELVEQSQADIIATSKWHLGTTTIVVARPTKDNSFKNVL
eukprot:Plantae.Rhodophyta-Purpureofilum_apyrenoidigerum.ctg7102.p1 GENE.Plantae.Rhodophyta-Purpureofilum_apyrenoidigerum.ctg7102~~Plantae.Rhodophyta-Purpureofilum_apyrenoidigerum.ctg7102.p1  ORF type:complete len:256 (+),score=54.64 Plantae.Rhodophyta-Purpureofilum_apyrenoidigerum.ctg7102:222-989(+)